MLIRIEGFDLPGRSCGPGPDFPDGHYNVHVAVQGRRGQQDLHGLVPGDVPSALWELEATIATLQPTVDLKGPQIQGTTGKRFIYLTWGVVDDPGAFIMFRRAKLWLNAVPDPVIEHAAEHGILIGRLGLKDGKGCPLCASVRPPRIQWSAGT